MVPRLEGRIEDMGDILVQTRWIVKGRRSLRFIWHIGAAMDTNESDRVVNGNPTQPTGKVDLIMDLLADKKVPLTPGWTDELGNPVTEAPANFAVAYSVDDPTIINLTDNGDGTAVAAAVGTLGTANVHADVTVDGNPFATGDLQIVVVAGLAERFNIVAGEPEEVTPDQA